MTRSELSPAVTKYFDLMDDTDRTRVLEVFTTDARVTDDGQTYIGHPEILGWLTGPASEYTTTTTWLSAQQNNATALVVMLVEGNFPGGRVELRYEFEQDPSGFVKALNITT